MVPQYRYTLPICYPTERDVGMEIRNRKNRKKKGNCIKNFVRIVTGKANVTYNKNRISSVSSSRFGEFQSTSSVLKLMLLEQ
jgi:hypothetical protein